MPRAPGGGRIEPRYKPPLEKFPFRYKTTDRKSILVRFDAPSGALMQEKSNETLRRFIVEDIGFLRSQHNLRLRDDGRVRNAVEDIKMRQLTNQTLRDAQHIREALSHVLQIRA